MTNTNTNSLIGSRFGLWTVLRVLDPTPSGIQLEVQMRSVTSEGLMAVYPKCQVRDRYNGQLGVVESVVFHSRGPDRTGTDAEIWVHWSDGTTTAVGEDDVELLPQTPPCNTASRRP